MTARQVREVFAARLARRLAGEGVADAAAGRGAGDWAAMLEGHYVLADVRGLYRIAPDWAREGTRVGVFRTIDRAAAYLHALMAATAADCAG